MRFAVQRWFSWWLVACSAGAVVGCGEDEGTNPLVAPQPGQPEPGEPINPDPIQPADGVFESDAPRSPSATPENAASGGASAMAAPGGSPTSPPNAAVDDADGESAGRAIEEADIIKVEGGLLYALSQYGGLSVIDVSQRDALTMLGRHKIQATPFEMYVREGIVFALYNGYSDYAYDEVAETWAYYQTSYVVALDTRDAAEISVIGKFAIPGNIADSRIVGDVLYVAAYEDGYCWDCSEKPRTNLISLDVSDPAGISKVDELSFEEREDGYSWRRSVMATDQRLYIAGPTWSTTGTEPVGSTIQVIDISDPGGDLVEGDSVQVVGQINSRWQMDEFEGTLRVVSQPFSWNLNTPPTVATYTVVSSAEINPLGSLAMTLPRAEMLQSVRFDGSRGYAVTFERTDPLFTLDLSNPAQPRQVGELEMPGWLYHMEPRGDRLLGLGFDQGNAQGAITVSLFDVSDLAKPTMIDRVNFGGDWGSLPEDQDRIHKAFNILDDQGLVLVPFSGWEQSTIDSDGCYQSSYLSGVQLVDFGNDQLDLAGVAPAKGQARRGFIHDERLFAMSDERVESFDISDRAAPKLTATLPIAQFVHHAAGTNDKLVRIGSNWWTDETELDVTSLAKAESPTADGRLTLSQMSSRGCYSSSWLGNVHSNDDQVYLMYRAYEYRPNLGDSKETTQIVTVDVSNPEDPKVVADVSLGFNPNYSNYYYGIVNNGQDSTNIGSTLALVNRSAHYDANGQVSNGEASLDLVDLSEPSAPKRRNLKLASSIGGTGLLVSETMLATSHYTQSPSSPGRVRFFLDRVDLADAQNPVVAPSLSIPGSLLAYDAASEHAITVDYREHTLSNLTAETCYRTYGNAWFEAVDANGNRLPNWDYQVTPGVCHTVQYSLRLVDVGGAQAAVVDSFALPVGHVVSSTSLGDDRLFVSVGRGGYAYLPIALDDVGIGGYRGGFPSENVSILVLGGIRSGEFSAGSVELARGDQWGGFVPLAASGERAVVSTGFRGELSVIDAADATRPTVVRTVETAGYVQDLDVVDGVAVVSMGQDGVQTLAVND
jgi:uncharacterized secreted protein with C-terminal beta-propeller domain